MSIGRLKGSHFIFISCYVISSGTLGFDAALMSFNEGANHSGALVPEESGFFVLLDVCLDHLIYSQVICSLTSI